jgi:hypothetical protein
MIMMRIILVNGDEGKTDDVFVGMVFFMPQL